MENFGKVVKDLRTSRGWSKGKLEMLAGLNKNHVSIIESRPGIPRGQTVAALANAFGMTVEELLKNDNRVLLPPKSWEYHLDEIKNLITNLDLVQIPLRGTLPGTMFPEAENVDEYVEVPRPFIEGSTSKLYALKVMEASLIEDGIYPGDVAVVDPDQCDVIDGQLYIVCIENEVRCCHVYKQDTHLRLVSGNGEYRSILTTNVQVLGRLILSGRWNKHY